MSSAPTRARSSRAGLHEGLPLGVQIIGKPFAERTILEIGKAYQDDTGFPGLRPLMVDARSQSAR
jgi:Asp-tRNA(Asn)/Glu-tRNA(Gln) amidotransferase A subunit family amidase